MLIPFSIGKDYVFQLFYVCLSYFNDSIYSNDFIYFNDFTYNSNDLKDLPVPMIPMITIDQGSMNVVHAKFFYHHIR